MVSLEITKNGQSSIYIHYQPHSLVRSYDNKLRTKVSKIKKIR